MTSRADDTPPWSSRRHRNPTCLRHLIDHAQRHGEDRIARKSAHHVGDHRLAALHVDTHAEHRIDQTYAVGTRLLAGASDRHDVGHVGRELDYDGFFHRRPDLARDLGGALAARAEAHAAAVDVEL